MANIKIKFTDNEEIVVVGKGFAHNYEHKMIFVHLASGDNTLMLPEANVKFVGMCNGKGELM